MFNFLKKKAVPNQSECIQKMLRSRYDYRPTSELNFSLSSIETLACFAPDTKLYTSTFYICDVHFVPMFAYSVNAYIHSCAISSNGKYAIFQTAHADSEDGNKFFLVNVEEKAVLWKKSFPTGWKHMSQLAVDAVSNEIIVSYGDDSYRYDFNGDIVDKEKLKANKIESVAAYISPYALNEEATTIINASTALDIESLAYVQKLLSNAEKFPKMSAYQLSLTYKILGDILAKNNQYLEARAAYSKGLSLNEKLSVKRSLSAVEKALLK